MKVTTDQITEVTAPTVEPISLTEAKSHLRVDISDDNTLIGTYITAARQYVENYTGRSLVWRTYRAYLPCFADEIILPQRPISSITSVYYYDTASPGALTLLASTYYSLVNNVLRRTYGSTWPSVAYRDDAVQVTFVAGFDPTSSPITDYTESIPQAIKSAVKLIVGDLYENREAQHTHNTVVQANATVKMLLDQYRVYL